MTLLIKNRFLQKNKNNINDHTHWFWKWNLKIKLSFYLFSFFHQLMIHDDTSACLQSLNKRYTNETEPQFHDAQKRYQRISMLTHNKGILTRRAMKRMMWSLDQKTVWNDCRTACYWTVHLPGNAMKRKKTEKNVKTIDYETLSKQ